MPSGIFSRGEYFALVVCLWATIFPAAMAQQKDEPAGQQKQKLVVDVREYVKMSRLYVRTLVFKHLRQCQQQKQEIQLVLKDERTMAGKVMVVDGSAGSFILKLADGSKFSGQYEQIKPSHYPKLVNTKDGDILFALALVSLDDKNLKAAVNYLKEAEKKGHKGARALLPQIEALAKKT